MSQGNPATDATDVAVVDHAGFIGIDDEALPYNGGEPAADTFAQIIDGLNAVACSGRNVASFWGGDTTIGTTRLRRWVWPHKFQPGDELRSKLLILRGNGSYTDGQGILVTRDNDAGAVITSTITMPYDLTGTTALTYPENLELIPVSVADLTMAHVELSCGSTSAGGPQIRAGCFYEPAKRNVIAAGTYAFLSRDHVSPGREIYGKGILTSTSHVDAIRDFFIHMWNRKRPLFPWSQKNPGVANQFIGLTTSPAAYRGIFDQSYGDGGTTPTITGPGDTMPLYKAGSGINTTIKIAVFVYAAMAGASHTGSIGISTRSGTTGATMSAITALTGGLDITGTAYRWYPHLTATTFPTFNARTDLVYDHVLLCARSSNASEEVRIAAISLVPMHCGALP